LDIDADEEERKRQEGEAAGGGFMQSRLFSIVRVVATLAILVGLIIRISPEELLETMRDADPWLLVAAFCVLVITQVLVIAKWVTLLRNRDIDAPLLQVVRAYCVGNLLSTVLPTAVGGDVYRVYRIQHEADARAADVTMTVLYERATGYAAMTCVGALGAAFYYGSVLIGLLALVAGVLAAAGMAYILPRFPFPALRDGHFLRNLLAHRQEAMVVYRMAVFSLLIQALYISTITLTGRALGAHISWWYWAFATWIVAVAVLLPVTLGGLGIRESTYAALIKRAGGTAAQGASTGFMLALLMIGVNALGLLVVEVGERLGFAHERAPEVVSHIAEPVPADRV
jgi:uncharacterized membrane protein YbhN (UPF0104 family)